MNVRASQIPWSRLIAEGAAIVTSILLAFAIDAWWQSQGDRDAEQQLLASLTEEFRANQDSLRSTLTYLEGWKEASTRWLDATPEELRALSREDATAILVQLLGARSFHPADGVQQSAVASGRLGILRDLELRSALGGMWGLYAEVEEELARDFELRDDIVPTLPPGTLLAFMAAMRGGGTPAAPDPGVILGQMRADLGLVERFLWKDMIRERYMDELRVVEAEQARILALIEGSTK